jgi:AraC-like DNA-binding protein
MKRARSVGDFVNGPIDRYFVGACQLVWCQSPTLCGSAHWGPPSENDMRQLTELFELTHHPALADRFDVFMDIHRVELVDWSAFDPLLTYLRRRMPEWARRIRKQAVVVAPGPTGMSLAGMVAVVGMTYPMQFFADSRAAIAWLARDDAAAAIDEAERLVADVRQLSPVVEALRGHLEGALADATVERAARALRISPRSLQRELQRAGTRFNAELAQARVRAACSLLEHSDDKIESIARRVGLSSSFRLSALFRRVIGETPATYRDKRRRLGGTG